VVWWRKRIIKIGQLAFVEGWKFSTIFVGNQLTVFQFGTEIMCLGHYAPTPKDMQSTHGFFLSGKFIHVTNASRRQYCIGGRFRRKLRGLVWWLKFAGLPIKADLFVFILCLRLSIEDRNRAKPSGLHHPVTMGEILVLTSNKRPWSESSKTHIGPKNGGYRSNNLGFFLWWVAFPLLPP